MAPPDQPVGRYGRRMIVWINGAFGAAMAGPVGLMSPLVKPPMAHGIQDRMRLSTAKVSSWLARTVRRTTPVGGRGRDGTATGGVAGVVVVMMVCSCGFWWSVDRLIGGRAGGAGALAHPGGGLLVDRWPAGKCGSGCGALMGQQRDRRRPIERRCLRG